MEDKELSKDTIVKKDTQNARSSKSDSKDLNAEKVNFSSGENSAINNVDNEQFADIKDPPKIFKVAPAHLHRISSEVHIYPQENTESRKQMAKYVKQCDMMKKPRPDITLVKDSLNQYVSKFGNLFIDEEQRAKGISTFLPSGITRDAFLAAHDLFKKDGTPLDCFVLPKDTSIEGVSFLYDRDIVTCSPCAHHVTIYPVGDKTTLTRFNSISTCKWPEDTWQVCQYRGSAINYEEPDIPLDPIFEVVLVGLEKIALNTDFSDDVRFFARLYQYTISDMEWIRYLQGVYEPHFFLLVLTSLVNYLSALESGHLFGTISGAISDLISWFDNQEKKLCVHQENLKLQATHQQLNVDGDISTLLSSQFNTSLRFEEIMVSKRDIKILCKQDICEAHVPVIVQKLNRLQFGIDSNRVPEVSLANSSILHTLVQHIPIFNTPSLSIDVDDVVYNFVAVCDNSDKKSIVPSPEDEETFKDDIEPLVEGFEYCHVDWCDFTGSRITGRYEVLPMPRKYVRSARTCEFYIQTKGRKCMNGTHYSNGLCWRHGGKK